MKRTRLVTLLLFVLAFPALKADPKPAPGKLKSVPVQKVKLLPGLFKARYDLSRKYVMSLSNENLLQNFYLEAGLKSFLMNNGRKEGGEDGHWGWESPSCQLRGHFLGHWLSAAAWLYASSDDHEAKAKADAVVAELAACQARNGGEWVGSIPEKYLHWIGEGKPVWAPQYTMHKTIMGLLDMYLLAGNRQALEIIEKLAPWYSRWTKSYPNEKWDDILDVETGGMQEVWAELYNITGKPEHLELVRRYERRRLFNALLAGQDPLTNRHANTTIPEAQGAARSFEVTGEPRFRAQAEAYWKKAVTDRGYFCTGGQTTGEIWTPPHSFLNRLSEKTQEHCVVYNMIRLADYLFRWTGEPAFADYIERNLYNGILAQQNPQTGMIAYFLPLRPGSQKVWGSPTNDFWCCHGSLVQAQSRHGALIYYEDEAGLTLAQYIPSSLEWEHAGTPVRIRQTSNSQSRGDHVVHRGDEVLHRPDSWLVDLAVEADREVEFELRLRLPWWLKGEAKVSINGQPVAVKSAPSSFVTLRRVWKNDRVSLVLPKGLTACPMPDAPEMAAFLDGPVVLAGLSAEEIRLSGDQTRPESVLVPDNEREWGRWTPGYRTRGQERNFRFLPLYEVVDEPYTIYFPINR
ncbi:MAG: hypothetical protein EHM23_09960 [Acidobacteria bacterium]|nr:MAG: hypothetical protein EHM23_09960 [Acidobacteriota bacterium]